MNRNRRLPPELVILMAVIWACVVAARLRGERVVRRLLAGVQLATGAAGVGAALAGAADALPRPAQNAHAGAEQASGWGKRPRPAQKSAPAHVSWAGGGFPQGRQRAKPTQ